MTQQLPETHSLDDAQPTRSARMAPDVTQKDKHKTQEMVPTVSSGPAWLPQWTKDTGHSFSKHIAKARKSTIESTPAFLVNNASNFLGFMHMLTEMLMFKSGMKGAKLVDNPENLINWVKEPIQNITADIYSRGGAQDYSFGQLFRGNPFKNVNKYIVDTHDASLRELERQVATKPKKISFGNSWQTRTTGTGLAIWTLSTLIPERKESDGEIERMAKMRTLHPVKYVGERLKQAVWFPQWGEHKREMLGLGYLFIGIFSGLGAFRNRGDLNPEIAKDAALIAKAFKHGYEMKQGYKFNLNYFVTAVISFIAGLPLLFALDERKAYSTYGSMSALRIPFLFGSIGSKVQKKEEGWQYYTTGKLTFQVEDALFSLIGGATKKKRPDGTYEIIDHEALKQKAITEAKEEKLELKKKKIEREMEEAKPTLKISQVAAHEIAMPERFEEQKVGAAV